MLHNTIMRLNVCWLDVLGCRKQNGSLTMAHTLMRPHLHHFTFVFIQFNFYCTHLKFKCLHEQAHQHTHTVLAEALKVLYFNRAIICLFFWHIPIFFPCWYNFTITCSKHRFVLLLFLFFSCLKLCSTVCSCKNKWQNKNKARMRSVLNNVRWLSWTVSWGV